jgi:hypothetical protein
VSGRSGESLTVVVQHDVSLLSVLSHLISSGYSCTFKVWLVINRLSRGLRHERLRSLERWDRGFESHSTHGYLFPFILCLCVL